MVLWRQVERPYRVQIPALLGLPDNDRLGVVIGEHSGIGGSGPLVHVRLNRSGRSVAAIKANCTVFKHVV